MDYNKIRGACKGTDRLNKKALLSFLGPDKYVAPASFVPFSNIEYETKVKSAKALENFNGRQPWPSVGIQYKTKVDARNTLNAFNGNHKAAASSLGLSVASFMRRLEGDPGPTSNDEARSIGNTRRYLEGLVVPWSITSFDISKREVCLDIRSDSGTTHLAVTVPSQKV
jgi:hypothetical protein